MHYVVKGAAAHLPVYMFKGKSAYVPIENAEFDTLIYRKVIDINVDGKSTQIMVEFIT